jgi:hypothetical protein
MGDEDASSAAVIRLPVIDIFSTAASSSAEALCANETLVVAADTATPQTNAKRIDFASFVFINIMFSLERFGDRFLCVLFPYLSISKYTHLSLFISDDNPS